LRFFLLKFNHSILLQNKKVFVGGLPGDFPGLINLKNLLKILITLLLSETELRKHFEQFGRVDDVEWPFDKVSKLRKNFAFVVFADEESADRAAASPKQQFASREVLPFF
jgi:RNA recognition motif-containing protein